MVFVSGVELNQFLLSRWAVEGVTGRMLETPSSGHSAIYYIVNVDSHLCPILNTLFSPQQDVWKRTLHFGQV